MSSSRLDLSERDRLHALYETGMSMRAIADALERAPSTIGRELRRHQYAALYLPDHAQRLSEHRRTQASRRPRIDAERIARIELLLGEDFSPEQIAGRTGLASHEWIYRHICAVRPIVRGWQLTCSSHRTEARASAAPMLALADAIMDLEEKRQQCSASARR